MPKAPPILIFTAVNPTRPYYEQLRKIHHKNLQQNSKTLYYYMERECVLPTSDQKSGVLRGQNWGKEFNQVYLDHKHEHDFICCWHDDMVLPRRILHKCLDVLRSNPDIVGTGLFQEQYGAPFILMTKQRELGFRGAFARFWMYRMTAWNNITIEYGGNWGDPLINYQKKLKGKKAILNVPSIHLDHRCFTANQYKVILDLAWFMVSQRG